MCTILPHAHKKRDTLVAFLVSIDSTPPQRDGQPSAPAPLTGYRPKFGLASFSTSGKGQHRCVP